MSKKFTSTIAGASIFITIVGLLSRGLGFIREVIFAAYFGLGENYEIYLVGAVLPITLNTVIFFIGQNYFIPNYNKYKVESEKKAEIFTNNSFWFFILLGIIVSAILFFLSSLIIDLYLENTSHQSVEIANTVFKIFTFSIPLYSGIAILAAFLQAKLEFKYPAISQLFFNFSIIILVLVFANSTGVYSIVAGYLAGIFLQFLFLFIKVKKHVNLFTISIIKKENIISVIQLSFVITVFIEAISQIYLIADRFLYSQVEQGGIAALNYSYNIFMLPISIFSIALSTAIFPSLSKHYNENSIKEIEIKVHNFFSVNLFLFIPITLILICWGDIIIKLLFERGKFSVADTQQTFSVLKIYAISLIFWSSYSVLNKIIYSSKLVKYLLLLVIAASLLKIFLNLTLVDYYQQSGLAFSTTLSYIFFFVIGYIIVVNKLGILKDLFFLKELFFNIINGLLSYLIVYLIFDNIIVVNNILLNIFKISAFVIIYLLNASLIKAKSLQFFLNAFKEINFVKTKFAR